MYIGQAVTAAAGVKSKLGQGPVIKIKTPLHNTLFKILLFKIMLFLLIKVTQRIFVLVES